VLNKISHIIRGSLDRAGCQELLFPTIQPGELWEKSGRLASAYGDEKLVITDRGKKKLVYGPTAEEISVDLFTKHFQSYKQLPLVLHNIQWKFRDEIRPRFGIKRAREFLMLDAYSFDESIESAHQTYKYINKVFQDILSQFGFNVISARADSGEIGGDLSHELIVEGENGEVKVHQLADGPSSIEIENDENVIYGNEVGHTFYLGDTYSSKFNAKIATANGDSIVYMGCYGIGVSRVLGVIAEKYSQEGKLNWPVVNGRSIAPYDITIIPLHEESQLTQQLSLALKGYDVLIDARQDTSLGEKLGDAELTGIPLRIVIGKKEEQSCTFDIKSNHSKISGVTLEAVVDRVKELLSNNKV
jgi:prolyl-tRNA synthetase